MIILLETVPNKVHDLLEKESPEATVLNIGFNDLTDGKSPDIALERLERLIWTILDSSSKSNLCIQSVLLTKNDRALNKVIDQYNKDVFDLISDIRRTNSHLKERLFTLNNDTLQRNNFYKDDGVHLNEDGNKKLMLRLKDSIIKALRSSPSNSFNRTERHHNE